MKSKKTDNTKLFTEILFGVIDSHYFIIHIKNRKKYFLCSSEDSVIDFDDEKVWLLYRKNKCFRYNEIELTK